MEKAKNHYQLQESVNITALLKKIDFKTHARKRKFT